MTGRPDYSAVDFCSSCVAIARVSNRPREPRSLSHNPTWTSLVTQGVEDVFGVVSGFWGGGDFVAVEVDGDVF